MNNLLKNDHAVSSVIGVSILFTITLLSIALMIMYTAPLISESQDLAKAQKAKQAFIILDSRTSKASLGESPLQTTSISLMGENVEVYGNDDAYNDSRVKIILLYSNSSWYNSFYKNHMYWNAWESYESTYSDFTGFEAPMGSVRYYQGNKVVAYEGGGVWSKEPAGNTIMTSPPEFHFNGETITLPIVKVIGNGSISGSSNVDIKVISPDNTVLLYPNTSLNAKFTNPLNSDKILIYIKSDFYDGWADYAETLTSTTATRDHENKTAIIEMDISTKMGTYPLTNEFYIIGLDHADTEPMHNLSFFYEAVRNSAANFNPTGSSLTLTSGTKTLVYSITNKGGGNDGPLHLAAVPANPVKTSYAVEYTDSALGKSEIWQSESSSEFPAYYSSSSEEEKSKSKGKGKSKSKSEATKMANSTIDFLSETYLMEYDSNHEDFTWGSAGSTSETPDLYIIKGNANSTLPLNNITQHYTRLLAQDGDITCTWTQKNNDKIDIDISTYTLIYNGEGTILTYLHITSNEVEVTLN